MAASRPVDKVWLSPAVLEWPANQRGTVFDAIHADVRVLEWREGYRLWQHAEKILARKRGGLEFVDAIIAMKRAVDSRVAAIRKCYDMEKIPLALPRRAFDQLEHLGVVRPLMLTTILDLRNEVEHDRRRPPALERCRELLDFVWYFMRSTDALARIATGLELEPGGRGRTPYWLELDGGPINEWQWSVSGWVPPRLVSRYERPNSLLITPVASYQTYAKMKKGHDFVANPLGTRPPFGPRDIHVRGVVHGPPDALLRIVRRYFQAV